MSFVAFVRPGRALLASALALTALAALPVAAGAQAEASTGSEATATPEAVREARALFNLAHAHYDAGRFAEAAVELEHALALAPRPQLYFDLHLAYREMGDAERSAGALRHYLAEYDAMDPEQRVLLERRLAALERTLAERGTDRGGHAAEVHADEHADEGHEEAARTDEALRAETARAEADGALGSHEGTTGSPRTDPVDEGLGLTPGVVALTVGGLALVGAAIAGGVSLTTMASRDGMCTAGASGTECPSGVPQDALQRDFALQRDVAWGLLGAGAAVAVTGAVLVALAVGDDAPTHDAPTASVGCTMDGCGATVRGAF